MEMEVLIPTTDFDFNSGRSSPCLLSAPATPKRFGDCFFSAPTSPTRLSQFYHDFDELCEQSTDFDWEEKPGTPKSIKPSEEDDFAFDVSEETEKMIVPAEQLFHGGKIRPLTLPTQVWKSSCMSPRSPISRIRGAFSPRKKKESNPFGSAIGNTNSHNRTEHERGRERVVSSESQSTRYGRARSLSPYRVSKYPWEEQEQEQQQQQQQQQQLQQNTKQSSNTSSTLSFPSSKGSHRKWRLKDFFLFRSASEGRASDRDPLRKYAALFKKHEDAKNSSSFRSMEGSTTRRKGTVSAHELHYKANRAVSEDLKKKTFLPYKQGILGRLAFNPTVHALANGFGFSRK